MKLEEKISLHRKQNGWSQEELAFRLGVSRQAVSKWEMGASVPDLDNILKMSELFACSTDHLLKEEDFKPSTNESEFVETTQEKSATRKVSDEEGETYLGLVKKNSWRIAAGVACCVLAPACMFFMQALAAMPSAPFTASVGGGVGVGCLLLFCAIGIVLLISGGVSLSKFDYLEKEEIVISETLKQSVLARREQEAKSFALSVGIGVGLCVIAAAPMIVAGACNAPEHITIFMLSLLLALVAVGVFLFVKFGMVHGSYQKLLQEEEYAVEKKREEKRMSAFSGAYWCLVTAGYLAWSFITSNWGETWIVWPIAGVLFAALYTIVAAVTKKRK